MRTGVPTLHQALTPEAATILKLSLSLAQRRNHAQVTPLHVATTLLTSSTSPSLCTPSNILKRACLKSQQQPNYQNTLLHCRALELCFNVALNRLPTCTSPSSSSSTNGATTNPNPNSLMHASYPTLSNALVAALKRAQANQRRGCIELQQQQSQLQQNQLQQNQNQNQQPLLAIKVELEQLIISILDDPSVSRVMREAGFSSSLVKSSLEEEREKECSVLSLGQNKDLLQTQFMKPIFDQDPLGLLSQTEDVKLIFEVMGRKMQEKKKNNPVLVGDSVSLTEGLVEEVRRRLERGDVPEELKGVQFVKFSISTYMQLGLVGKGGIEAKVEELKRNVGSSNGVVVYVGDLKWAIGDERRGELDSALSPIRYIVEEIEKLVCGSNGGKVWVLGIASYQTYMQVKRRRPSLEVKWGLHAVTVPCGGLSLSLQAPAQSALEPRVTRLNQSPFQLFEAPQKVYFAPKEEGDEDREILCFECNANYEREASIVLTSDSRCTGGIQLPSWLQPDRPDSRHKVNLMELRRKWSRLCQKLHHFRDNKPQFYPSFLNSNFGPKNMNIIHPIWGPCNQSKPIFEQNPAPFQPNCPKNWPLDASPDKEIKTTNSTTNLFLGGLFNLSDSASSESKERRKRSLVEVQELEKRLYENIPWQSGVIASIVEAFEKKNNLIFLEGNDKIAKRRVALVIAETYCGSTDKVVRVNLSSFDLEIVSKKVEKEGRCVVLIEGINQAPADLLHSVGSLKDHSDAIIVLSTSESDKILKSRPSGENSGVVNMRFLLENDLKRKSPSENVPEKEPKRNRGEIGLDLNLCASEDEGEVAFDEEEAIPSDITHESDGFERQTDLPQTLLQKIGTSITIGASSDSSVCISNRIVSQLNRACREIWGEDGQFGNFVVDKEVVEWLVWASGSCLEALFEKWVREVFQTCIPTVKKGGKVRLGLVVGVGASGGIDASEGTVPGFCGSVLPEKIHLD
ncbi:Double Clp-N motif-containing P-loop nucleoside triphosphate hydrolases superfamily protein [Rhynchospora pubera]|uniref:Double Clp-N motif-containing P-loop nucleoside triphosphate hydrolases superfamily protein n=1 Tax=Rhynchospora pubera TaxID=906938 RepID=A0AAV8CEV0_9POAL|nr:Double Clp-N motif-containing P-loop nucleoside triphosphate hydrolases superfamily protein [Rhynchospora pubera]